MSRSTILASGKFGIIAICESWCNDTITDAMLISDPGSTEVYPYSVFRKDRSYKDGGGVLIFVHKKYTVCQVDLLKLESSLEIVAIDITTRESVQRFVCVYRTGMDREEAKKMQNCISRLCSINIPVTIVGDFNLPDIDWNVMNAPDNGISDVLMDCFLGNNLTQFVREPTRGQNILDLVFSNDKIFDI